MERDAYNELMAGAKFKPGDLVWTSVKTYSPWPGKVLHVSDEILKIYPGENKIMHYVELYMKKERDFLPEDELWPFNEGKGKFSVRRRSALFHDAVIIAKEEAACAHFGVDFIPPERLRVFERSSFGNQGNSHGIFEVSKSESLALSMERKTKKDSGTELRSKTSTLRINNLEKISKVGNDSVPGPSSPNVGFKRKLRATKYIDELFPSVVAHLERTTPFMESYGDCQAIRNKEVVNLSATNCSRKSKKRRLTKKNRKQGVKKSRSDPPGKAAKSNDPPGKAAKSNDPPGKAAKSSDPSDKEAKSNDATGDKRELNDEAVEQPELKPLGVSNYMLLEPRIASLGLEDMPRFGFLGLGGLGKRIVRKLLADGHKVVLWNRSFYKCYEMVDNGAQIKSTPEQVVNSCDVTFCCVADTSAVKQVFYSDEGVMSGIREGKTFVVLTTIDPNVSSSIENAVISLGGMYLEAPMFPAGGDMTADSFMTVVAGNPQYSHLSLPYLHAFVKDLFYVGVVPEANKMVLLLKALSGVKIAALAESMALARRCNVPTDLLFDIVKQTQIASPFLIAKAEAMLERKPWSEDEIFPLAHFSNDLTSTLNLTTELDTPVFAAAKQVYLHSKARGYSEHDVSAVFFKFNTS